ncbi:DUF1810 family protein [Rhodobacteraceae bacterium 2CG4]|uniref:DUF1810 family protein n=1 Tax=Halovulum marinum TaxID=2662447 RepID=A0A6L5YXA1_9RHOB|nr:DUF1810 domain-containing protein [Halovulum marinum]MSU88589.1 DUF1810 family protein [Halovulum marinum]
MTQAPETSLERFVAAQDRHWEAILAELRAARKVSHWMWYVFPQLRGLGRSATAQHYGIAGIDEARAYLAHPVLGPRLRECAALLLQADTDDPEQIMGPVDAQKLRSSMTLFDRIGAGTDDNGCFGAVLARFYGGAPDPRTLAMLPGPDQG